MPSTPIIFAQSPHKYNFCDILRLLKEKTKKKGEEVRMKKNKIEKIVANVAYETSKKSANSMCAFFFHQPKLPTEVKKLRKF